MPFTPCLFFTITVHAKLPKFYLLYRFCRLEGKFFDIVHQDRGDIIAFYSHVLKADMLNVPKTEIASNLSKKKKLEFSSKFSYNVFCGTSKHNLSNTTRKSGKPK